MLVVVFVSLGALFRMRSQIKLIGVHFVFVSCGTLYLLRSLVLHFSESALLALLLLLLLSMLPF